MSEAIELATAYVQLVPSLKGAQGKIADELSPEIAKAGDQAASGFGAKFKTGLGKLGGVAKAAAVGIGAAAVAGFAGLYKVGETFDEVSDTIRVGTGATGAALDGLVNVAKDVGKTVPVEYSKIGPVVADLNTRLGLSGDTLNKVASQYLEAGRILGQDVDIQKTTAAFSSFGIKGAEVEGAMDSLFRVSQATGVGMNELAASTQKNAAMFTQMGMSFEQAAGMVGVFDKAGLTSNAMLAAMSKGMVTLAKAGEEPQIAMQRVAGEISNFVAQGNDAAALDLAAKMFGTKGAPQFVKALKDGTINAKTLTAALETSGDTITGVGKETMDFAEQWQLVKNNAMAAVEPLATPVFGALGDAMKEIVPHMSTLGASLAGLVPAFTSIISAVTPIIPTLIDALVPAITQIIAAIAPILPMIAQLVAKLLPPIANLISALIPVITPIIDAIIQIVSALMPIVDALLPIIEPLLTPIVAILKLFTPVLKLIAQGIAWLVGLLTGSVQPMGDWGQAWETLGQFVQGIWNGIAEFFTGIWNNLVAGFASFGKTVTGWWDGLWSGVRNFATNIWNGIVGFIKGIPGKIMSGISALGQLPAKAAQWFLGVLTAAQTKFGQVIDFAKSIPGKILGALGNIGSMLVNSGKNLVSGFLKGIKNAWDGLVGWVKSGMDKLRGLWPFSPAKWGPFSGTGYVTYSGDAITTDFAASIEQGTDKVYKAASGMMDAAALDPGQITATSTPDDTAETTLERLLTLILAALQTGGQVVLDSRTLGQVLVGEMSRGMSQSLAFADAAGRRANGLGGLVVA